MTLATLGQDVDAHCVLTSAPILMQMRLLMFLCDAKGCVDLDILDPREINNHLFARAPIGRAFAAPRLVANVRNVPDLMSDNSTVKREQQNHDAGAPSLCGPNG